MCFSKMDSEEIQEAFDDVKTFLIESESDTSFTQSQISRALAEVCVRVCLSV